MWPNLRSNVVKFGLKLEFGQILHSNLRPENRKIKIHLSLNKFVRAYNVVSKKEIQDKFTPINFF